MNKMKNKNIKAMTVAVTMIIAMPIAAQRQTWNIDSCINYAVKHGSDVRTQRLKVRQAKTDYKAAVASFFPTLTAGVSGQYSWGRNIDPETNTYNDVTTFNNYYDLYASLSVFDGMQTINSFKQARLAKKNAQTALEKVRDERAIEVMEKYVEAVYNTKSVSLAEEKLADSRKLLQKTQRMFDLGQKSLPDLAQIKAQVAEDEYDLVHQRNVARQAMLALKSSMSFPVEDSLNITYHDIDSEKAKEGATTIESAENIYKAFVSVSPEVLTAEATVKDARYDYLIQKGAMMPQLTLYGTVATNYYKNITQGTATTFRDQFKNNRGEYVSLSLSIPIFSPSKWRSVKRAKTTWQTSQIELEDTRRKLHDDIAQAVMDRDGYATELAQMERKVEADSLAHHLNTRKFEEGMFSVFDIQESAQTLLESRIKLLQMRMMLFMKQRLVNYYKGERLWNI